MVYKTLFLSATIAAFALPAAAADVPYDGPAGWSHAPPASTDTARKVDQWHISGDVSTVTFIADSTSAYSDAVGAIEQNFKTNGIKAATDKDMTCQGKTGHVVEFTVGPDGHKIVINRLLIPSGTGVVTITYTRSDGSTFDSAVKKSETAYCDAPPA
ncbi:MAG: hypothetical protein IAI50_21285 [Candidatus Eremiobacteraeota bacterium]|nr:hypothetical protein [Candidatus Eremiobacteraeota bacterium]